MPNLKRVLTLVSTFAVCGLLTPSDAGGDPAQEMPVVNIMAYGTLREGSNAPAGFILHRSGGDMFQPLTVHVDEWIQDDRGHLLLYPTARFQDYRSSAGFEHGDITFPPGWDAVEIHLTAIDDAEVEGTERIVMKLAPPSPQMPPFLTWPLDTAVVDLFDNEAVPADTTVFSLEATDPAAAEVGGPADPAVITVRRRGDLSFGVDCFLDFSGRAVFGTDYVREGPSPTLTHVNIPAGADSATVRLLPILDGDIWEGREDIRCILSYADRELGSQGPHLTWVQEGPSMAEAWVEDILFSGLHAIGVVADPAPLSESREWLGGRFRIVSLDGPLSFSVTVPFTLSGSATVDVDYKALSSWQNGEVVCRGRTCFVTIPAGQREAYVFVRVVQDAVYEGDENIVLTLVPFFDISGPFEVFQVQGSATLRIEDDDRENVPVARVSPVSSPVASVGENDAQGVSFELTLDHARTLDTVVRLAWPEWAGAQTATPGVDFRTVPASAAYGTVVIPAGSTGLTIQIIPVDDSSVEGREPVWISLAAGQLEGGYIPDVFRFQGETAIEDDDYSYVSMRSSDAEASEDGDPAEIMLERTGNTTLDLDVSIAYAMDSTAKLEDFSIPNWTVRIPAGASSVAVRLQAVDDRLIEGSETLHLTLGFGNYGCGASTDAVITLLDNDRLSVVDLVAKDAVATEPRIPLQIHGKRLPLDTAVFTLARKGDLTEALTVAYAVSGTARNGVDYVRLSGTVVIPAGMASADVVVTPRWDRLRERDETVVLALKTSKDHTLGSAVRAQALIRPAHPAQRGRR